jgi:hypothetical protein
MFQAKSARSLSLMLVASFAVVFLLPAASLAGVKGRRNTAIGLTAGAVYALGRHKTGTALALGAGSAYAWKRYGDSRRGHNRYAYRNGYRRGYRAGYYGKHHRGRSYYASNNGRHVGWSHSRYYRGRAHRA